MTTLVCLCVQVLLTQHYGCRGLIIYSDPADCAPKDGPPPFPNGWSLSDTGIQQGTLKEYEGDVLIITPNLPAIGSNISFKILKLDGVHRRLYQDVLEAGQVPSIPVQPISYGDAEHFLSRISGPKAPDDWQGQINITYNIGPDLVNRCVACIWFSDHSKFKSHVCYQFRACLFGSKQ